MQDCKSSEQDAAPAVSVKSIDRGRPKTQQCSTFRTTTNGETPEFVRLTDSQLIEVMLEELADFGSLIAAARAEIQDPSAIVCRPISSYLLPSPRYCGRVLLIGDATHTATSHMASCAGIAIEDAIVLAERLQSEPSLPPTFGKFMTRRYERSRMLVENSFQFGEWEKTPGVTAADPVGLLNKSLRILAQPI